MVFTAWRYIELALSFLRLLTVDKSHVFVYAGEQGRLQQVHVARQETVRYSSNEVP